MDPQQITAPPTLSPRGSLYLLQKPETLNKWPAMESKKVALMKHMLFLRRWDLCEYIQRWLSLPNTTGQGTRNSWETGLLPSQPLLISRPPPCLAQPPHNTQSRRAQLLSTRLSRHRNRWQMAKGTRGYKRSRIPTWTESTTRPGTAPRAQQEKPGLGPQSFRLERAFLPKELLSLPRICHRSVLERLRVQ